MKRTSFGSLKRLFACLSVPREVVSCLLPGSLDLSFQKFALGHGLHFPESRALRGQFTDASIPVAQASACATAAKARTQVLSKRAGRAASRSNIFRGNPDGVANRHCCAVVTPPGARGIPHQSLLACKPTIRPSSTAYTRITPP